MSLSTVSMLYWHFCNPYSVGMPNMSLYAGCIYMWHAQCLSTAALWLTIKPWVLHHFTLSLYSPPALQNWLNGKIKSQPSIYMITPDHQDLLLSGTHRLMCLESTVCSTSQSTYSSCWGESVGCFKGKFKAPTIANGMQHCYACVQLRHVLRNGGRRRMSGEHILCFIDAI